MGKKLKGKRSTHNIQSQKNYKKKLVSSNDYTKPLLSICVTTGRLTPNFYEQMAAGVNVSYGLYHYSPFLVELQDCTFVRETLIVIHREHCPGLRRYSKWVHSGLVMVSTAVMMSLVFWVIYGRERWHGVYTKAIHARDFDKAT